MGTCERRHRISTQLLRTRIDILHGPRHWNSVFVAEELNVLAARTVRLIQRWSGSCRSRHRRREQILQLPYLRKAKDKVRKRINLEDQELRWEEVPVWLG